MYEISSKLCLKLSYRAAKNASLMDAEAEWASEKAGGVLGSLGQSKMEGESTCRPSVLFTSVASTNWVNQVSKFRTNFFFGSLKPGTTQKDDCPLTKWRRTADG